MADFVKVANKDELKEGSMKGFTVGGEKVLVLNVGGKLCAVSSLCTHVNGPLDKGSLKENVVTCPWHHSEFDVTNGAVLQGPAKTPLKVFEIKVVGEDVLVKV